MSRDSLRKFYQSAILKAREPAPAGIGLDMNIPVVVMEWMPLWHYWNNKWDEYFPKETYGSVILDTHIYDFKDTVEAEEKEWDNHHWDKVNKISKQVPTMIGEYTLSLSVDIPIDELQGWAQYIQDRTHSNGTIGSAHWMWNNKAWKFWSMRSMSNLVTEGGIDWSKVFA